MIEPKNFSTMDCIIILMMFSIAGGIGVFFGCFKKIEDTTQELLIANRKMGVLPASMSIVATFMSGLSLLGTPLEIYLYGTMYLWAGVSYIFVVITTANVFIPLFLKLEVTSAYEYLEKRFNKYVRLMASCIFIIQTLLYLSIALYGPSLAISEVFAINIWIVIVSVSVVCSIYTALGGIKVVMWTDAFQIFTVFVGLITLVIMSLNKFASFKEVILNNLNYDRIEFFVFDFDPTVRHTVWGLTIGFYFQWLSIYGVNQSQVQRYLCLSTVKKAKQAVYFNLIGLLGILFLSSTLGLFIFHRYRNCDPFANNTISNGEELLPLYLVDTFDADGLYGLFFVFLFSGVLSTISSGLNGLTAVALEDIIKRFIVKDLSEKNAAQLSKILCLGFGIVCFLLTFLAKEIKTSLTTALGLFGIWGGIILGLFFLGLFVPFSNASGAIFGSVISAILNSWIFIGNIVEKIEYPKKKSSMDACFPILNNRTTTTFDNLLSIQKTHTQAQKNGLLWLYSISYTWYGFISVSVVIIFGSIIGLLKNDSKKKEINSKLNLSLVDELFPFLPEAIKKFFRFGYIYSEDFSESDKNSNVVEIIANRQMI